MQEGKRTFTACAAIATFLAACAREGIEKRVDPASMQRPQVALRNPQTNAVFPWNAEIHVAAEVRDIPNAIVEFEAEDKTFARDAAPPYEAAFRPRWPGPVVITAQVRDARGSVIAGDAVTVTVVNPNPVSSTQELSSRDISIGMFGPEPLVDLKAPADGAVHRGPADVPVRAEVSGLKAPVRRVEFLVDGTVVGTTFVSGDTATGDIDPKPIEYLLPNPAAGRHVVMVRAIDSEGRVGTSKAVTVIVNAPNSP